MTGSTAGRSLIEMIWERLDEVCADLMGRVGPNDYRQGEALGLATALSILISPYSPDIDAVRAESVERYERRLQAEAASGKSGKRAQPVRKKAPRPHT